MKPTLTPEQSAALSAVLKHYNPSDILRLHADDPRWHAEASALTDLDLLTLASALVNGWEVEKSPVDILRERFAEYSEHRDPASRARMWCAGVLEALGATGQYVEGINA